LGKKYRIKNKSLYKSITRHKQIIEQLQSEKTLHESEEKFHSFVEQSIDGIILIDEKSKIIEWNHGMERITGAKREKVLGCDAWEVICSFTNNKKDPQVRQRHKKILLESFSNKSSMFGKLVEHSLTALDGTRRSIQELSFPIKTNTGLLIGCIVRDITEQKKAEQKIKYLAMHDTLTGIHNRTYFEEHIRQLEMEQRFPLALIICDVDGLKLVNDTMGHKVGDEILLTVTSIIKKCLRKDDRIARIGGDEFAILLPYKDNTSVETICNRIQNAVDQYNQLNTGIPLSISLGFSVKDDESTSIDELFKEADYNMYQQKLFSTQRNRSTLVKTLMEVLVEKNYITEGHADRLQYLVTALAKSIGLSESRQADLRLFGQFYDIGKIGIPDSILLKPGPLTPEEAAEMMRHSEIGHRIALSAQDLYSIANWILYHHEWWNGEGYPLGFKGEKIPLECRILAIADAYDAMTSSRPYRKAMSHEEAIAELKRCSGTQFDPELVNKFIKVLKQKN